MGIATVTAAFIFNCNTYSRMLNYSLFKVAGRSSGAPVVILTGPTVGPQSSTPARVMARIVRALFGPRATAVVFFSKIWRYQIIAVDLQCLIHGDMFTTSRARLMLDILAGFFYARTYQPLAAATDSLKALHGVNDYGLSNGDSRFYLLTA